MNTKIKIEAVAGVEGNSCYINGRRVCGNKPWGGGSVIYKGETVIESIMQAIGVDCNDKLQSPWHPNKDGDLPKKSGRYLVMAQNGFCHTCKYKADSRYWDTVGYQSDIKYWMEIPELPTE